MKTRRIEPDEKFVPGMLLYYTGLRIMPPTFLVVISVIPVRVQPPKLRLLDDSGKINGWEISRYDGSPRDDVVIVVLEDEDENL